MLQPLPDLLRTLPSAPLLLAISHELAANFSQSSGVTVELLLQTVDLGLRGLYHFAREPRTHLRLQALALLDDLGSFVLQLRDSSIQLFELRPHPIRVIQGFAVGRDQHLPRRIKHLSGQGNDACIQRQPLQQPLGRFSLPHHQRAAQQQLDSAIVFLRGGNKIRRTSQAIGITRHLQGWQSARTCQGKQPQPPTRVFTGEPIQGRVDLTVVFEDHAAVKPIQNRQDGGFEICLHLEIRAQITY